LESNVDDAEKTRDLADALGLRRVSMWSQLLQHVPGTLERDMRMDRSDLERVKGLLPTRDEALGKARDGLKRVYDGLTDEQLFALAATDVFVEKAQFVLTRRSRLMYISGVVSIVLTALVLWFAAREVLIQIGEPLPTMGNLDPKGSVVSTQILPMSVVILRIFQSTALSAALYVAVKLFVSLGRSFFHEALSLLERRHALRFGRLYVYLMKGVIEDEERLEAAFHWNKETRTSFLDMRSEIIAETLIQRVVTEVGKVVPAAVKIVAATKTRTAAPPPEGK
jgi:hypothetical protein